MDHLSPTLKDGIALLNWSSAYVDAKTIQFYNSCSSSRRIRLLINSNVSRMEQRELQDNGIHYYQWEIELLHQFSSDRKISMLQHPHSSLAHRLNTEELLLFQRLLSRHILNQNANEYTRLFIIEIALLNAISILTDHGINFIIFPEVPHAFGDYAFLVAGRLSGLDMICIRSIPQIGPHICAPFSWSSMRFHNKIPSSDSPLYSLSDLETYNKVLHQSVSTGIEPYNNDLKMSVDNIRKLANSETINLIDNRYVRDMLQSKVDIRRRLLSKEFPITNSSQYIVYFLQYEPEMTTCPLGRQWFDQLSVLAALASLCEKFEIDLVVREHPQMLKMPQSGIALAKHFYDSKNDNPRPINFYKSIESFTAFKGYANTFSSDFYETENLMAFSTVTGSLILEAFVKRIPILIPEGLSLWCDCLPNIFPICTQSFSNLHRYREAICHVSNNLDENTSLLQRLRLYSGVRRDLVNDPSSFVANIDDALLLAL